MRHPVNDCIYGSTASRAWHRPSFLGVEQVDPSRPTMFVGNHTLYGVQDVPQRVHGIFPRTLADRGHFAILEA